MCLTPPGRYVSDTPRYLGNTWGVRRRRPKLVRSQKPEYLQTPRAGMGPTPRDISKIPGVSSVTGQNLSEAKSQGIGRHPAGMFLTPRDISKIPGVSGVTGRNLSEAKSQGICRHPRGYGPDTTFAPRALENFRVCLSGVRGYFGFWLLTSFGRWCRTPQVFLRYHGVSETYLSRGCQAHTTPKRKSETQ